MTARQELEQIIARLKVMSHVPSGFKSGESGGAATDEAKGGRRPTGGLDRKDDRQEDWALKSAEHYQRRLDRAHTDGIVLKILEDARKTLRAWTHTPPPREPERDSYYWRLQIVNDVKTGKRDIDGCRVHYSVSRATVYNYLRQYGEHRRLDDAA